MEFRTPTLIALSVLLAATALSVLGLAADNVAYFQKHHNDEMSIHYNRWNLGTESLYSYWVTIKYAPSRFSLAREDTMIAASVICFLVGAGVAVGAWMMRGKRTSQTERSSKALPVSMALAGLAFVLSLAAAVYAWYPVMRWSINFMRSLPVPPSNDQEKPVTYMSPFDYTPEVWNCLVAPYAVQPSQSRRLQGLCHEAQAAKYLTIPLLVFSAALVVALGLSWRQERRTAAVDAESSGKEAEEVSVRSAE